MILSDIQIVEMLKLGEIFIDPFDEKYLQGASYDLHLGNEFLIFDTLKMTHIDPKVNLDNMMKSIIIKDDESFIIHPQEFALALVKETTGVGSQLVGRLEGKSSVGRLGLMVHVTAGFLDPKNCLKMTLELHNTTSLPIILYPNMPIAQMAFETLTSPTSRPYNKVKTSKYVGDSSPKSSQMWKNFVT